MKVVALGYLGFRSPKFAEWLTLGPEVFGLGLAPRGADGSIYLRVDDRHHRMALHPGDIDELAYAGWELRGRVEFESALKHLENKDVAYTLATPEELQCRSVSAMAHFLDPAGFRHEIFFGAESEPGSFLPGRALSGFVTGQLGLGHFVLAVPEVTDELRNFALDVMGFTIFAGYRAEGPNGEVLGLEFYRCNARSHCMAYIPGGGKRGITHMCLEVGNMDDVGRAYDLVEKYGIPLKYTLGRHSTDTLVSFYVRTPTGFEFEYGYGGELFNDETFMTQKPTKPSLWGHKTMLKGWGSTVREVENNK